MRMLCPRCETVMLDEIDRRGVTIDLCKKCRGVWLDRGELEKIFAAERRPDEDRPRREADRDDDDYRRRKKSRFTELLGELFD